MKPLSRAEKTELQRRLKRCADKLEKSDVGAIFREYQMLRDLIEDAAGSGVRHVSKQEAIERCLVRANKPMTIGEITEELIQQNLIKDTRAERSLMGVLINYHADKGNLLRLGEKKGADTLVSLPDIEDPKIMT